MKYFSGLGLLFFLRFNCWNFCLNFLGTFGFEFFRYGETRLGGKDLRWFVRELKNIRFLVFFSFFSSNASHFFLFLNSCSRRWQRGLLKYFSSLGLLLFLRFNRWNFWVNFLGAFGFEFFRFGKTRLGGKDLRSLVKGN